MNQTISTKCKPVHEYGSIERIGSIYSHYGVDTSNYNALLSIANGIVVMASGKFVVFINFISKKIEYVVGPDDGAVGVVGVHPARTHYIVGERRPENPRLLAYEWPSRKHVFSFEGGCLKGYAACAFNKAGTRIATVGSSPDYTLSIWDWSQQSMILRSKCFGAEVDTVRFSPFDDALLVTGGSGHIKFWTMAHSFTGLKLQGTLGKFGSLEISSITGFEVFRDGKVLSGSESGCLLIWEGDLVRCCFVGALYQTSLDLMSVQVQYDWEPCHSGPITVIELIHDGAIAMSAGEDGAMRYWNCQELERAEGEGGQPPLYAPACLLEVCISPTSRIRSVTHCTSRNEWVVLDTQGTIWTTPFPSLAEIYSGSLQVRDSSSASVPSSIISRRLNLNGGAFRCCALSPRAHVVVTGGDDGAVRLLDYVKGEEVYHSVWPSTEPTPSSVVALYFFHSNPNDSVIACGFSDGTLRLLRLLKDGFLELGTWRPHTGGLFAMALDHSERQLCTASRTDGTIFFFKVSEGYDALEACGFCRLPLPNPVCLEWDAAEGDGCLVGYETGEVLAIHAPRLGEVDNSKSFEFPCSYALLGIRQRRLPPQRLDNEEAEEEEDLLAERDDGPWPVSFIRCLASGGLVIGMHKEELVYRYQGSVRYPGRCALPPLPPTGVEPPDYVEDPGDNLCYRDCVPHSAFVGSGPQVGKLLVVCEQAIVLMFECDKPDARPMLIGQSHDSTKGHITSVGVSYDGSMVITTGTDMLMVAQLLKDKTVLHSNVNMAFSKVQTISPVPLIPDVKGDAESKEVRLSPPQDLPIPHPAASHFLLSIQEQKEAEDRAKEEAERKQEFDKFYSKVSALNERYTRVLAMNSKLSEEFQLDDTELELDARLTQKLEEEMQRRIEKAREEWALKSAREEVRTKKMRNRFLDNLLWDRFCVHAFSREFSVASFRTANPALMIKQMQQDIDAANEEDREDENEGRDTVEADGVEDGAFETDGAGNPTGEVDAQRIIFKHSSSGKRPADQFSDIHLKSTVVQQLQKAGERRRAREERRIGYERLLKEAPDPKKAEIELAELRKIDFEQRGECVLRTDLNYKGDDLCYPTSSGKLKHIIRFQGLLVNKRSEFNEELKRVREEKRGCLRHINALRFRIGVINKELKDNSVDSAVVQLLDEEEPERIFEMTREDLDAFLVRKNLERQRQEQAKKAQRGFGADLAGIQHDESKMGSYSGVMDRRQTRYRGSRRFSRMERTMRHSTFSLATVNRERLDMELKAKIENIKLSELEIEELTLHKEQLLTERRRLAAQCQRLMSDFDTSLCKLFRKRVDLDADFCLADAHILLLFNEYEMLLTYRARDSALRSQRTAARKSRDALQKEVQQIKGNTKDVENSIAKKQDSFKAFRQEVEAFIQESFPSDKVPYVLKVFNRTLKRRKKADEDIIDDDVTSDDDDDDDTDDDDEIKEEACPAHCDVEHWEKVLRLRERRQDLLNDISEMKLKLEELKKSLERSEAVIRERTQEIKACQKQKEDLEDEKRRDLNLLDTVVPLYCSQVLCLDENLQLPSDLPSQPVLVVAEEVLQRLQTRISELDEQKAKRRQMILDMSVELSRIQEIMSKSLKMYEEWKNRVSEVMMLKFGRHVDLGMLESCGTSQRIESMKEELRRVELKWAREVRQRENEIYALRRQLQGEVLHNTHLLQDIGDYESDRQAIERALIRNTSKTEKRFVGSLIATQREREDLSMLIISQKEEIAALSAEIAMLRRKGGHIYTHPVH
ncbi:unnamed protein product [Phytomonas sp. EM1]|nr:unnamed protein product [Phytomonas sp. EM1]|eukprot:CCW64289.1 unnamed protein product [Phytomonas sp. isolate EM1]